MHEDCLYSVSIDTIKVHGVYIYIFATMNVAGGVRAWQVV